jgi:hypothetical protein
MKRQSNVVLRVYERRFDDERGKGKAYQVRIFGGSKLDRMLMGNILKHHFEGSADEEDIPYAIWQATSSEDWEVFASKPQAEWTNIQRAAYDSVLDPLVAGGDLTWRDVLDHVMCFVDGYEEGYKRAQEDRGLPVRSALYPEEDK